VDSFLVREEVRPAGVLYELAHERLIVPILRDNKPWREKYQGLLQSRAKAWEDKGSPSDAYLLSERELREAEEWARVNEPLMTDRDRHYLAACQAYHRQRERKRIRKERITYGVIIGVTATVAFLLALLSYRLYRANQGIARANRINERLKTVLEQRQEMAAALEQVSADPGLALGQAWQHFVQLHGLLAPAEWPGDQVPEEALLAERRGLDIVHRALHESRVRATWVGHSDEVNAVAYDPSGGQLASAGNDLLVIIRDARSGAVTRPYLQHALVPTEDDPTPSVVGVAFDPRRSNRLATATSQGAFLWTLPDDRDQPPTQEKLPGSRAELNAIAIDRQGGRIAAAGGQGVVQVWTVEGGDRPALRPREYVHGKNAKVYGLAFGGPSGWLASAGNDSTVRLWRATAEREESVYTLASPTHSGFRGVAFSADGRRLATAGEDGTAHVWELQQGKPPKLQRILYVSPDRVNAVAFSSDGATSPAAPTRRTGG
jgi:WD40 domain-containing protein